MDAGITLKLFRSSFRLFKWGKTAKTFHIHLVKSREMCSGVELTSVVNVLESYTNTALAEKWDNVGLLVEPSPPHNVRKLFLTNDLTENVLDEAIQKSADMILSYHPPLFRPLKRITQAKWKDRIVVRALEHRIAVFSPHTSYDVAPGGVNDWLISCFDGNVTPIIPNEMEPAIGAGRFCQLSTPLAISEVIEKVKTHLQLQHIRVAYSYAPMDTISSIACCAGSGSSVLHDVKADIYITGEMSHHEILDAVSNQTTVLLCEHSNTERGFMRILAPKLTNLLKEEIEVIISERDKDPVIIE